MAETEFTRGFRLHLPDGTVVNGAAFPSSRIVVIDDLEFGLATSAGSIEELLAGGYHGARVEWADSGTCDASHAGLSLASPVGPCILRREHDGPVHKDINGATWSRIPGDAPTAQEQL